MTEALSPDPRVALLVDGDNLSHLHAGAIILAAAQHGTVTVKRVYGNMATHPGWDDAPGFRSVHSGRGKNAADLALSVDAMALMLGGQADVLVIASSDGDFSHLALHLVERGHKVVGLGEAKTPEHFRKSCTVFRPLAEVRPKAAPASQAPPSPAPPAPPKPAAPATLGPDELVAAVRRLLAHEPKGLQIALLSTRMAKGNAVQISQTQYKTWRAFLSAHQAHFLCDPKGPQACVHLKP